MLESEEKTALSEAVAYSRSQQDCFRENQREAVKQYVGSHYTSNGSTHKVPIPLIELAVNIYLQRLVASSPAVSITTKYPKLKETCSRFKIAANHLIKDEINLENTMERGVIGALFCMGVVKVGLNLTQVEYKGVLHDKGQPFADYVTMDNWVHDMTADNWEQCQFMGDRYSMTVEDAKKIFPKNVHHELDATSDGLTAEQKVHNMTDNNESNRAEYKKTLLVWDIYLPRENRIVTFMDSGEPSDPLGAELHSREWYGVETGPYHILAFNKVEGNTMPLPPVALWMDLHELANKVFRKLGRQAERQKTFTAVPGGSGKDGQRTQKASDGGVYQFDNPDKVKEVSTGGINPQSLAFMIQTKELFSMFAGNLDLLGGLGPQSDTVGQDSLLQAGASQRIQRMQKRVYAWAKTICEALCFYLYNDPYIKIPITKRIPFIEDIEVMSEFGPDDRNEADFMQYNINIEPHSMQHMTPEQKVQAIMQVMERVFIPLAPFMAQQGVAINYQEYAKTLSELTNLPELESIIITQASQEQQPVGQPPQKMGNKTTTNVRVNRPGATNPGKDQIMKQALLNANPQGNNAAATMRPTG